MLYYLQLVKLLTIYKLITIKTKTTKEFLNGLGN